MSRTIAAALVLSLVLMNLACNKTTEHKDESFTYQYRENGCSTEKQTFKSKEAYCDGLKNHRLNKFCAYEKREKEYHDNNCKGSWPNGLVSNKVATLLDSGDALVRKFAVQELENSRSPEALALIEEQLRIESDPEVIDALSKAQAAMTDVSFRP